MKRIFLGIVMLNVGLVSFVSAQSLEPQVFATSGTHYENASGQLDFTIGECLTSTYVGSSYMVTQGFHQPRPSFNGDAVQENESFVFNIYPNPATNYIVFSTTDPNITDYTVDLIDNLGQVVQNKLFYGNNQQMDISTLAAGNYHLRITFLDNKINSFTIIKTTNH